MRRRPIAGILVAALAAGGAAAQTAPAPRTLEDIRQNLAAIAATVQALRAELLATGGRLPPAAGNPQMRLDTLEAQLRALTGRVEELQNRVRLMAEDAGRRYAEVEFRLSEIEGGAAALLPEPIPLGGMPGPGPGPGPATGPFAPAVAVAVTEQNAFDAAQRALDEGRDAAAAEGFRRFLLDYPGSPLTAEAAFGLGEAELRLGQAREAARSYLAAFNAAPQGPRAARALYGVASALQALGQFPEACLTFAELPRRFPGAEPELLALAATQRAEIGCR